MNIKIFVREEVFIHGLPHSLIEFFQKENTFSNPKVSQHTRMFAKYLAKDAGKDITEPAALAAFKKKQRAILWQLDHIPPTIDLWRIKDNWLSLPRGFLTDAIVAIESFGYKPEIQYSTIKPPLTDPIKATGSLFDYQWNGLCDLVATPTGVMQAPTGSGKTNTLLTLIPELKTPSLVVVHTTDLLDQTVERCKGWLNYEPGTIGGKKKSRIKDITIGMIQSLSKMNICKGHELYDRFGAVIVDECHHSPAETWAALLRSLPCHHKYGFSATAWRKDKLEFLIWRMIGPMTAQISHEEVEAAGRIVWPEIRFIETQYQYNLDGDLSKWGEMLTDLANNPERNILIKSVVVRELGPQVSSRFSSRGLILTDRIEHANILGRMLTDFEPTVLTGDMNTTSRKEAMAAIHAGAKLTIATIHLLGEGIDVPGWDMLFLASPLSGGPRTLQAAGRIARPAPGKDRAILFDFWDVHVEELKTAGFSRMRLYRTKGK